MCKTKWVMPMRRVMAVFLLGCVALGSAQAQLKIDFGIATSPVETGYKAWTATHEQGTTFVPQTFEAFGTTITVAITWPSSAGNAVKQMFDRSTDSRYAYTGEHGDLIRDWTGTDGREANANPLTLTLTGLPAGVYSWLSYHHDGIDQTGVFSVTVKDALGSKTTADVPITNSAGGDNVTTFDAVSKFKTEIASNGKDDVVLEFTLTSPTTNLTTAFFVMNAFEVEVLTPLNIAVAQNPNPKDKQSEVLASAVLSWKPGCYPGTHNVYLGTDFNDVNDASINSPLCVSKGQDANSYDPATLGFGVTYYWRVDEVNASADATRHQGKVWSFTTEPIGYPIDVNSITATASASAANSTPRNTIDKSGLTGDLHGVTSSTMWITDKNPTKPVWLRYDFDKAYKLYQMLVWNANTENELELNYGLQNVTIEYTSDGTSWTKLGDYVFEQATATVDYKYNTVIDFGGITAQSVKITAQNTYGGSKYSLAEVRFLYIPVWAREPKPDVNSVNNDPRGLNLTWRPGREAASHDVYLGTDPAALTLAGTVPTALYVPTGLSLGTKYYWRVDEVNNAATPKSWTGAVWYFSTPDFLPVDNFESYNDKEGTAVFNAWTDGYGTGDNGGQIGYDVPGPYMEKTIRHGGAQSTPFYYKNVGTPAKNFSEATRTFDTAQDWTVAKANTLRIWVRGRTPDLPTGSLPAATTTFDITGAGSDIYQATDQFRFVYRQLTGDGSITAKVDYQQPTNQYAKAGVMIRVGLDVGALETHMITMVGANNTTTTPLQVEWNFRPTVGDATARTVSTTPTTPSTWVRLTRKGDVITGEYSADGVTWVTTGLNTSPQTIPMGSPVNIGLVVCSHVAGTLGEAKFSNVKVTGNVAGEWQKADVGITTVPTSNTADTFYVAVTDNAGKTKTVIPTTASPVCTTGSWQAVDVPFSQLTGVSLTSVKSLTFGVGDKTGVAPQHGTGLIYVDDIGVGRPAAN